MTDYNDNIYTISPPEETSNFQHDSITEPLDSVITTNDQKLAISSLSTDNYHHMKNNEHPLENN